MPDGEWRLDVGKVGERLTRAVECVLMQRTVPSRFESQHGLPRRLIVQTRQDGGRSFAEACGQARLIRAATALADRCHSRLRPTYTVPEHGVLSQADDL